MIQADDLSSVLLLEPTAEPSAWGDDYVFNTTPL